jgi:DNA-binding response OmpR family regulator
MNILVVDDEENIRLVIREYLEHENYLVDEAINGIDALDKIEKNKYDLIILDIMMPKMNGFDLLRHINSDVSIIMLSAKDTEYDKLDGFNLGIDDYITKPFSPKELVARVKAVLNRSSKQNKVYKLNDLEIDYLAHSVKINNKKINITPKEFDILSYLINNKNIAVTREQLLNNIWGYNFYGDDRTIDAHIKMLRNNLGEYRKHIVTVHGIGYKFVEDLDA